MRPVFSLCDWLLGCLDAWESEYLRPGRDLNALHQLAELEIAIEYENVVHSELGSEKWCTWFIGHNGQL